MTLGRSQPASLQKWTWPLKPSYLYSQVKAMFSNLFKIIATPLVGFASIGLRGMPTRMWQVFLKSSISGPTSINRSTICPQLGNSHAVSFIPNSTLFTSSVNSDSPSSFLEFKTYFLVLIRFGGVQTTALASAEITVFSAAPVLRFFQSHLTMYLASSDSPSQSILKIKFSFSWTELLPDILAIF